MKIHNEYRPNRTQGRILAAMYVQNQKLESSGFELSG